MTETHHDHPTVEHRRLAEEAARQQNWKRWGPYLAERQWATVREDYSPDGDVWNDFPHDHARSRAYRWGEDGILGICDRQCRLAFALTMWNGRDPILKERLFGLTGPEGNHGEDVKELYYYLDSLPTHCYFKGLYKYPQAAFPYERLVAENQHRRVTDPEYEITDTGVFDENRYFDVFAEYAKTAPNDLLIRITVANRGPDRAEIDLLPTLWFRNTWRWGCRHEGCFTRPLMEATDDATVTMDHESLGRFIWSVDVDPNGEQPRLLFTENETNRQRLWGEENPMAHVRDAFDRFVVHGDNDAVNAKRRGTKAAAHYHLALDPGESAELRLRLSHAQEAPDAPFGKAFDQIFADRIVETDAFYDHVLPGGLDEEQRRVSRQSYAGLLWSKQFYHYIVKDWLEGDPNMPDPPPQRRKGRNRDWPHLFSRDVISMPDKWEYPWFAAWDLAFHMVPMARIDPTFAKKQLILFLREWYMHPNGQIPAYEFAFGDVNPPVHAWACWEVYRMAPEGRRDRAFLASAFQKLLLNFTWWVNRKDPRGEHLFSGGFLGLDNIGVFDRSRPLPGGASLTQADGTAWMAFYCATMLAMAVELAREDPGYEDMASKFFEHYVHIADAINTLAGSGLWDEEDGFYYDQLRTSDHDVIRLRVRSLVGLMPLCAVYVLEQSTLDQLPGFRKRTEWFMEHRADLARHITYLDCSDTHRETSSYLLAIPSRDRLEQVLSYMLDESEFLSPFGIRSMSAFHRDQPFTVTLGAKQHCVAYEPGESQSGMFGGNSNWRGPIWWPINFLIIESLRQYHRFYGGGFKVECPAGSGQSKTLGEVADLLAGRLCNLFARDDAGRRPAHGEQRRYAEDPNFRDLVLFYEYFHGDTGQGLGASHQTGWTSLVSTCLDQLAQADSPS